ncbi:SET domain-containing protein [Variovorax sp. dw_954]|uniref:SET domain-containing protein-lysine N-methyltransferase n=1 Tax=Variovorax sp. dw_954 TaxID=2720078 RepID=UPI001BD66350
MIALVDQLFGQSIGDTIDGSPGGNATRHINHSCTPNCEAVEEIDGRGRLTLRIFSLRPLLAGEEIFLDYGLIVDAAVSASDFQCFCRTSSCRGSMVAPAARPGDALVSAEPARAHGERSA